MGERFAPANWEVLHKATRKARHPLSDEFFVILADDLRRLVALAIPNAPQCRPYGTCSGQFVDAVSSVRLQEHLKEEPAMPRMQQFAEQCSLKQCGALQLPPIFRQVFRKERMCSPSVTERRGTHLDLVAAMGNLRLVAERLDMRQTVSLRPCTPGRIECRTVAIVLSAQGLVDLPALTE